MLLGRVWWSTMRCMRGQNICNMRSILKIPFEHLLLKFIQSCSRQKSDREKCLHGQESWKRFCRIRLIPISLSLKDVSKGLSIHPSYLSREFSKYFDNLTFGDYIRKAANWKSHSTHRVVKVFADGNCLSRRFSDQSHFTQFSKSILEKSFFIQERILEEKVKPIQKVNSVLFSLRCSVALQNKIFCNMKWITRERPKIDRIACPWIIKNFVTGKQSLFTFRKKKFLIRRKNWRLFPMIFPEQSILTTEMNAPLTLSLRNTTSLIGTVFSLPKLFVPLTPPALIWLRRRRIVPSLPAFLQP